MTLEDLRELTGMLKDGTVKVSAADKLVNQLTTGENMLIRLLQERSILMLKIERLDHDLTKYSQLVKTIRSQLEQMRKLDAERLARQTTNGNGH